MTENSTPHVTEQKLFGHTLFQSELIGSVPESSGPRQMRRDAAVGLESMSRNPPPPSSSSTAAAWSREFSPYPCVFLSLPNSFVPAQSEEALNLMWSLNDMV